MRHEPKPAEQAGSLRNASETGSWCAKLRQAMATEQRAGGRGGQGLVESCETPSTNGSRTYIKHVWHFVSKLKRNTARTNTASFLKNKKATLPTIPDHSEQGSTKLPMERHQNP